MRIELTEKDLDAAVGEYFARRGLTITGHVIYLDRDDAEIEVSAAVEAEPGFMATGLGMLGVDFNGTSAE